MKVFSGSNYQKCVVRIEGEGSFTRNRLAKPANMTNQQFDALTVDELTIIGLTRFQPNEADDELLERFDQEISDVLVIDASGKITIESGLLACDRIRKIASPFCKTIDDKNICFVILTIDGEREVLVSINGGEVSVPGTLPPVENSEVFEHFDGGRPRKNDSEFKFFEAFGQRQKDELTTGEIVLFTEQSPCQISCKKVIEEQFPAKFGDRFVLNVSCAYEDQESRRDGVRNRQALGQAAEPVETSFLPGGDP